MQEMEIKNYSKLMYLSIQMAQLVGMLYGNWEGDFVKDKIFKGIETLKCEYKELDISYEKLSQAQMFSLGFRRWDADNTMLIPMWLFRLLPDDTPLISPLDSDEGVICKKDADDDNRFGCSAYCFVT